jgi:phage terminase small subunit
MAKGRKRKPIKLELLEGKPGHRKLPENELEPPDELIEPPSFLDEYALTEWERITPGLEAMGVLFALDINILSAYCCAYSIWRKATEKKIN